MVRLSIKVNSIHAVILSILSHCGEYLLNSPALPDNKNEMFNQVYVFIIIP